MTHTHTLQKTCVISGWLDSCDRSVPSCDVSVLSNPAHLGSHTNSSGCHNHIYFTILICYLHFTTKAILLFQKKVREWEIKEERESERQNQCSNLFFRRLNFIKLSSAQETDTTHTKPLIYSLSESAELRMLWFTQTLTIHHKDGR